MRTGKCVRQSRSRRCAWQVGMKRKRTSGFAHANPRPRRRACHVTTISVYAGDGQRISQLPLSRLPVTRLHTCKTSPSAACQGRHGNGPYLGRPQRIGSNLRCSSCISVRLDGGITHLEPLMCVGLRCPLTPPSIPASRS